MKIHFTKAEYRQLIEVVYLGEWLANSHRNAGDPKSESYSAIVQKIYSNAKAMGCEDLVEETRTNGKHFPTQEFESDERLLALIADYDEENFWSELIQRLSRRDLESAHPELVGTNVDLEAYWRAKSPIESKYVEEFQAHGLARVRVGEI